MHDPFPSHPAAFENPFAAFIMSEFHAPDVEARVRHEELAAIPGQVVCGAPHGPEAILPDGETLVRRDRPHAPGEPGFSCSSCGAAV